MSFTLYKKIIIVSTIKILISKVEYILFQSDYGLWIIGIYENLKKYFENLFHI